MTEAEIEVANNRELRRQQVRQLQLILNAIKETTSWVVRSNQAIELILSQLLPPEPKTKKKRKRVRR